MQYNHFSIQLQGKINYLIDHFWQANRLNWLHRKHTIELIFPSVFSIQAGYNSIYIKLLRDYHISFLIYAGSIPLAFSTDWITTWDIQKNLHLGQILPSLNASKLKESQKISGKGLKIITQFLPPGRTTFTHLAPYRCLCMWHVYSASSSEDLTASRDGLCDIRDFSFHVIWISPAMCGPLYFSCLQWDEEQLITFCFGESFHMFESLSVSLLYDKFLLTFLF